MPGIEDTGNRGINAGASAQPLVTPAAPVVEPNAVHQLVDSFRQGFITAQDITDRIGELGKAKKKAEISVSNLAGKQAEAALKILPAQAKVAEESVRQQGAAQQYGTGVQDFMRLAPLVPGFTDFPRLADGQLDYDAMGREGNFLKTQEVNKQIAMQNLVPKSTRISKDSKGQEYTSKTNDWGEEISEGSPRFEYYHGVLKTPFSFHALKPGRVTTTAPDQNTSQAPAPGLELSPAAKDEVGRRRAELVNRGLPIQDVLKLSDADILKLKLSDQDIGTIDVRPQAAPAKPTIEPAPVNVTPSGTSTGAQNSVTPSGVSTAAPVSVTPSTSQLGKFREGFGVMTGEQDQPKMEQQYRQELMKEFNSRSGSFGLENTKVDQAIHLLELFDKNRDPKTGEYHIPRVLISEIAKGLAYLTAPGGSVGEGQMNALNQKTAYGTLADIVTYVTGQPATGSTQAVLEMFRDSILRQGLVAEKNRENYFNALKALAPTDLDPERRAAVERALKLNTIEERFGNRLNTPNTTTKTPDTIFGPAQGRPENPGPTLTITGVGEVYKGADGLYYRVR